MIDRRLRTASILLTLFIVSCYFCTRHVHAQLHAQQKIIESGYLGIIGDDRAENNQGVRIVKVHPKSPADQGWLREGDLIIGIGDQPIRNAIEMNDLLKTKTAGEKITFRVQQSGRISNREVTLGQRSQQVAKKLPLGKIPAKKKTKIPEKKRPLLGVITSPITGDMARHLGISVRSGALVEHVFKNSPAEAAGIRVSSVIVSVAKAPVNNPLELAQRIGNSSVGEKVEIAFYFRGRLFRTDVKLVSSVPNAQEIPVEEDLDQENRSDQVPIILSHDKQRIKLLERENNMLRRRIEALENQLQQKK